MKKISLIITLSMIGLFSFAQPICDPNGNLMLYTNYDGGVLEIEVDANIPDLKIGVVTYEGTTIILSGAYINNVTSVSWAGMNGSSVHCGMLISTSMHGVPAGADTSKHIAPLASLSNPNGNQSIICGYSCDISTNQGGCNTVDQIEDYFMDLFPGSHVYAHKVQYGCWTGKQSIASGGNCCGLWTNIADASPAVTLSIYPNPSGDKIFIQSTEQIMCFRCVNRLGQLVSPQFDNNSFDISGLPSGMYLLMMDMESGKQLTKKFIRE
jgi:hypothetical protein